MARSIGRLRLPSALYGHHGRSVWFPLGMLTHGNVADLEAEHVETPGGLMVHWHDRTQPCSALCGLPILSRLSAALPADDRKAGQ